MSVGLCHAMQYGAEKPEPALNIAVCMSKYSAIHREEQRRLAGLFVAWAEHKAARVWSKLVWIHFTDFCRHLLLSLPPGEAAVNPDVLSHHPVS